MNSAVRSEAGGAEGGAPSSARAPEGRGEGPPDVGGRRSREGRRASRSIPGNQGGFRDAHVSPGRKSG